MFQVAGCRLQVGGVEPGAASSRRVAPCHQRPVSRRRGSAAVELIILLPVCLLILLAMMYVGELSVFETQTHVGAGYAMVEPGDQSELGALRGTISEMLYPNQVGELTVAEYSPDPADTPEPGEIRDVFDEMSTPLYSTYAVGRYVFENGQLRFVVSTHQSEGLSKDGKYVASYNLRDDHIPELSTDLLQGWVIRNQVDMTYTYSPDYISIGRWPLEPVDLTNTLMSDVRADKKREVADPPPGMKHQIDAVTESGNMADSGQLPHYPDFWGDQAFWEPN
jgi:hypothetical protein